MRYPTRNPFPVQATFTVEGSAEPETIASTLVRDAVFAVGALVDRYLADYIPGDTTPGRAVCIHGEHGTGKTHTLWYGLSRARRRVGETGGDESLPYVVYVRAEGPDLSALYRRLMMKVTKPALVDASLRALASLAREELVETREAIHTENLDVLKVLERNPSLVYQLFRTHEVEETAVTKRQADQIERTGSRREDFERVLPSLLIQPLSDSAYRWLLGDDLSQTDLARLGVSRTINSPEQMRIAIQLIAAVFRLAQRPLIIAIDQSEALITGADGRLVPQTVGMIRAIAEAIPRESGLLMVGMSKAAWQTIPVDLRQRFGPSEFTLPALSPEEATSLVGIYLAPWKDQDAYDKAAETYPFVAEAIRWILKYSGGNIRLFLQTCAMAFDEAVGDQRLITPGVAADAVRAREIQPLTVESARGILEQVLREQNWPYVRDFRLLDHTVDFVILGGDSQPLALIHISDAVYGADELSHAREIIRLTEAASSLPKRPSMILIVLGYSSPEVTGRIQRAVDELIIAEEQSLAGDLKAALDRLRTSTASSDDDWKAALDSSMREFKVALDALAEVRKRDTELVQAQLAAFSSQQERKREENLLSELRALWAQERQRNEDKIREARKSRFDAELEEMERLRLRAERDRQVWFSRPPLIAGAILLFVLLLIFIPISPLRRSYLVYSSWYLFVSASFIAIPILVFVSAIGARWTQGPAARELADRVDSQDDLERLARRYVSTRPVFPQPITSRSLLKSRNPQFRYAGALRAKGLSGLGQLASAFHTERSSLVRRRIVTRLLSLLDELMESAPDRTPISEVDDVIRDLFALEAPSREVALAVEWAAKRGIWREEWSMSLPFPRAFVILCGLYDVKITKRRAGFVDAFVYELNRPPLLSPEPDSDPVAGVVRAFKSDDDDLLVRTIPNVPERGVRDAIGLLAPFGDGLGSYDWLKIIDEVDELYLFFTKLSLFIARGAKAVADPS